MLDVHPPHHAANTWRDFFIHIATIVVGLLIAVGLEQTVEYFHHNHQRRELIESLNSDTVVLEQDARLTSQSAKQRSQWILQSEQCINDALWSGKPLKDLPPPPKTILAIIPSFTHFQAGKASGLLQLLSTEDMDAYSDLNGDVNLVDGAISSRDQATRRFSAFLASFATRDFEGSDLSRAAPADLRELIRLLAEMRNANITIRQRADEAAGASAAVLKGVRGIRELQQAERDEYLGDVASSQQPEAARSSSIPTK